METVRTKVAEGGRIVIPADIRREFGIEIGEIVNITPEADGLVITTPAMALRRLQRRFRKLVPAGVSLVDELIAERREEAANE
jgi:AbrB family looped-hinge helix DNA binding protein